jgi:hypothetical protein
MAREPPRLRFEHFRLFVALAVTVQIAVVGIVLLTIADDRGLSVITIEFLGCDLFRIVYASLTLSGTPS